MSEGRLAPRTNPDRAGRAYWNATWQEREVRPAIDPRDRSLGNWVNCRFDAYFRDRLGDGSGRRLIEVGCAGSAWLPYFAREFGFRVTGLDYSAIGCEQARQVLARAGVDANVVCGDLFSPPAPLQHHFDVVVSFGLVEHFQDTAGCLRALATLVRRGGVVLTVIPNMNGITGWLQKELSREVYDIHVPLTTADLEAAHVAAELPLVDCRYFVAFDPSVANQGAAPRPGLEAKLKRQAQTQLYRLSKLMWAAERAAGKLPASRWLSPYVVAFARTKDR